MLTKTTQKAWFRVRALFNLAFCRKIWWTWQGAVFGARTKVPKLKMTWPNQVSIGSHCTLENDIYFKFDGIWQPGPAINISDNVFIGCGCEFNIRQNIHVGNDCLIASGCKFIDHDHGIQVGMPMNRQSGSESSITVEEDVWLGFNVVVLKGVTIGKGAVVGAGAVVTKSVPPFEIWAGIPARKIGERQRGSRNGAEVTMAR